MRSRSYGSASLLQMIVIGVIVSRLDWPLCHCAMAQAPPSNTPSPSLYCVVQFVRELLLLRDRPSTDSSSNVLTKTEFDFIFRYITTACFHTLYYVYDFIIK